MKAVIVEIKGKFVAALSEDGAFTQMKNDHYTLGQQIEVNRMTVTRPKKMARMTALAACCALVCGLGVGAYAYMAPAYYVSMDVNPSVEYTLNTFDQVLEVQAVNEDGAEILRGVDLGKFRHKSIDEVLRLTLAEITREGYFDARQGGILLATSGKKAGSVEKLAAHLQQFVAAQCAENQKSVSVESMTVDRAQLEEAKALGVTPGKLLLVQKLLAEHPHANTTTVADWLKKPVGDIMSELERLDDLDDAAEDAKDAAEDAAEDAEDAADHSDNTDDDADNDADDEQEDDKPAAPSKPVPSLKQTKPAKPADTVDSGEKPDAAEPSDSEEKPDPTDPPEKPDPTDLPEKPDPTDPSEKPDPTDPPEKPDPTDPPEKPDPTDPPEKPDPTDPPEKPDPTDPPEKPDPTDPPEKPDPTDPPEKPDPTDPPEKPDPTDPPEKLDPTDPPEASTVPAGADPTEHVHSDSTGGVNP